jgi:diguanylate cyclase (GGDEF)-like protein
MLSAIILIIFTFLLGIEVNRLFRRNLSAKKLEYEQLQLKLDGLWQENSRLMEVNSALEKSSGETIALYDIASDICKSLDEDKIFEIFQERMKAYIKPGECSYLKESQDLANDEGSIALPLLINKRKVGFLIGRGIKECDEEKFHILAQQFLLGIKRAYFYKKYQELSITDGLTQVFNRRYFFERFEEEINRSKKFNLIFSFLMIDIDHFKEFNDHFGHLVGDAILREISKVVKDTIRQVDFIGRYGGEELSVVLVETDKVQAGFAAERIRQAIESKRIRIYDEELKITVSIGISEFPFNGKLSQTIVEKADKALYAAKEAGRNRICISK